MTLKTSFCAFALTSLMLPACSSSLSAGPSSNDVASAKLAPHDAHDGPNGYLKPGATVGFANSYDGSSDVGGIESFTVTVSEKYDSGTLTLQVFPDDSLTLYRPASEFSFDMSRSDSHSFDVQVGTPSVGRYGLNILVSVDNGQGQVMPSRHTVQLTVGDPAKFPVSSIDLKAADAPEKIVLKSQETVRALD